MILRSLRLQRFGRFRDEAWEFAPGLNVIRGPNEAGKSTMREAIVRLLFDRTIIGTSNKSFLALRTWGEARDFVLAGRFSVGDQLFELTKDFEADRIELRCNEELLTDFGAINERLSELLGVASREVYETTACVRQQEFAQLQAGRVVSELLQRTIAGPGAEASAREVIERLNAAASDLARGLDRPARRPGPIQAAIQRIAELDAEIGRLEPIVAQAEEARRRGAQAQERLAEVGGDLESAEDLLQRVERRLTLQKRLDDLTKQCTELEKALRQARELEASIERTEQALARLPDLSEGQVEEARELGRAARQAAEALPAATKRAEDAAADVERKQERVNAAQAALGDPATVRRAEELDRKTAATQAEVAVARERALRAEAELAGAQAAARSRRALYVAAAVVALASTVVALAFSVPWAWAMAATGAALAVYAALFRAGAAVDEVAERLRDAQARAAGLQAEADALAAELEALVGADADLRAMRQRLDEGDAELQEARQALAASQRSAEEAAQAADRARQAAEGASRRLNQRLAELGFESLEALQATAAEVFEQRRRLKEARDTLNGLLRGRTIEQLDHDFAQLNADRLGVQAELEAPEMALAQMSAEEHAQLKSRVSRLQDEQRRLEGQIADARAAASHPEADPERLRSLTERRAAEEERLERLRERLDATRLAAELLDEAYRETVTRAIEVLEPRTAELLADLTCQRYRSITFDRATLAPRVFSPEKQEKTDPDEELSCATREQVYLAARLALTGLLWPEVCPPIMLDDPLVNFDPERRDQALGVIRRLASETQVLLFTCQDAYDHAADRVIELRGPAVPPDLPG
ncbi:MAG: AAA family ATPase [Armatimonadota bacterium]